MIGDENSKRDVSLTNNLKKHVAITALVVSIGLFGVASWLIPLNQAYAHPATPPFTECPAIGSDTSCAILIVFNANGTVSVLEDTTQGPYDNAEDTLVGVDNHLAVPVASVQLSGPNIFGFDGDGICESLWRPFTGDAYCDSLPPGSSNYEGPNTSFTVIDNNNGTVNFTGGLAPGATTYFSLENALSAADVIAQPPTTAAPVGGEIMPISMTSLLVGGLFTGAAGWAVPAVVAGLGASIAAIIRMRRKKVKESEA